MAIFDENLKQEEELGFTANEMDAEDIFYAEKLDKYPGNFPSFDSMPVDNAASQTEALNLDTDNLSESNVDNVVGQEIKQEDTEETILDDELLNMLRHDVKEYQDRKEFQTEITGNDFDETSEKPQVDEQAIFSNETELDNAQDETINADIDTPADEDEAEQPSYGTMFTKIDDNKAVENNSNEIDYKNTTKTTEKEVYSSSGEEKKKKDPLKTILIGVATVMVLAFIGTFAYNYIKDRDKLEKKNKTIVTQDTTKLDVVQMDAVESNLESEKVGKLNDEKKIDEKSIARQNEKKVEAKQTVTPKKIYSQSKVKSKEIIRRTEQKDRDLVAASALKSLTQPKQEETDAVYVVQIYASPSREDAELRLDILRKKGIIGAITTQNIKGKIWYRVRFGNYGSYQDAKKSAKNSGFSEFWVERIK